MDTRQNTTHSDHGSSLFDDVDLLCLDAGNTVVFLDHEVVSVTARAAGVTLEVEALVRCEGEAKRKVTPATAGRSNAQPAPAKRGPVGRHEMPAAWGAFMGTMISLAGGLDERTAAECVRVLWEEHMRFNLWRRVPEGLRAGLDEARAAGVRVCVVSNSEGHLESLFERVGLGGAFDHVIDSALVGVEKPDPAIFELALERFGVPRERALHLGDIVATDVDGARAAGLRVGLIDPWAHYEGAIPDVPRVAGAASVARALAAKRAQRTR